MYGDIQRTGITGSRLDLTSIFNSPCNPRSIVNYYQFLESDFDSMHIIEGLLLQLRRYGFLHFCSEEIFLEGLNVGRPKISRSNFDEFHTKNLRCSPYWWRGYSPLIEKYSSDGGHDLNQMRIDWPSYWNLTTVPNDKKS